MIEPFKYLIQPVAVERDESGRIVAEKPAQVITVYSAADAVTAINEFEHALQQEGAGHAQQQDNGRAEADPPERPPPGGLRGARPLVQ